MVEISRSKRATVRVDWRGAVVKCSKCWSIGGPEHDHQGRVPVNSKAEAIALLERHRAARLGHDRAEVTLHLGRA